MPNAARLLSSLAPTSQSWGTPITGRDPDRLTPADIARAAASVRSELAYRWILCRYADYRGQRDLVALQGLIVAELQDWANRRGWKLRSNGKEPGTGKLGRLAILWIAESLHPRRCPACHGLGETFNRETKASETCAHCGGRGHVRWSQSERARWMGIRHSAYQKRWARRYYRLQMYMSVIEEEGLLAMNRAIENRYG